MTTPTALTKAGIAAFKANDRERALSLFQQATQADTGDQVAWLWLGTLTANPNERRAHLERAVALGAATDAGKRGAEGLARLGVVELPSVAQIAPAPAPAAVQTIYVQQVAPPLPTFIPMHAGLDAILTIITLIGTGWILASGIIEPQWAVLFSASAVLIGVPGAFIARRKGYAAFVGFIIGTGLSLFGLLCLSLTASRYAPTPQRSGGGGAVAVILFVVLLLGGFGYMRYEQQRAAVYRQLERDLNAPAFSLNP